MIGAEEREMMLKWFRESFPSGQCPMCQNPFFPNDPSYPSVSIFNDRLSLSHVRFVNDHFEQKVGEGTINVAFRCDNCAYVMLFDDDFLRQKTNQNLNPN